MKIHRILSFVLLIVLLLNTTAHITPANAQTQLLFEGMIAYVDSTGNIVLATGDGNQRRITSDADLNYSSGETTDYDHLSFSPSGSYLAFFRNDAKQSNYQIVIYDINGNSVVAEMPNDTDFLWQGWYKNTDTFILEHDTIYEPGSWTYAQREIYLQTIGGERSPLAKFDTHINAYNINFNIDTVIYPDLLNQNSGDIMLYNWRNNVLLQLNMKGGVSGQWTPDGKYYVLQDDADDLYLINLETGKFKEIKKGNNLDSAAMIEISPDSRRLLLGDYMRLYEFSLDTLESKTLYTTQYPSEESYLDVYGNWSPSGKWIVAYENDPSVDIYNNYTDLYITNGLNSSLISHDAEPYLWLSDSVEKFLYAKNNMSGTQMSRELMLYDHDKLNSVKIGDLPSFPDIETPWQVPTDGIVDWTDGSASPRTVPLITMTPDTNITPTVPTPTFSICPDAAPVQPIMLVVGWGGSEGSPGLAKETNEFAVDTREFFAKYGYVSECNIFYATGTSPNKKQEDNAREIQRSLCAAYDAVKEYRPDWNGHFDIIGHSYGGLRSRAYLEDDSLYGYCTANGVTERVIKVDNLFTLGSPHGGEPYKGDLLPLAALILGMDIKGLYENKAIPVSKAAFELLPPIRRIANKTSKQPAGVNYHLIIGNVTKDSFEYVKALGLWIIFGNPSANYAPGEVYDHDLAVHQESSLILSAPELKARYPLMRTVVTQDWHGWDPSGRRLIPIFSPPTYYSDSETLAREVLPYIGKTEMPSGGGGGGSWMVLPVNMQNKVMANATPISIVQQEAQTYAPQLNIHVGDGILSPGQSQQFEFTAPQAESMGITLITGNKDLQLQLIQPDGQSITKDTAGIQFQEFAFEGSNLKGYQMTNMLAGKWIVIVDGTASTEDASFVVSATPSTPIVLQPILPEWRPNQNLVEISTRVSIENAPITGGNLSALIIRPDGSTQSLDLFDDGVHQDGGANDGVYGNTFSQTNIGGIYRAFFTATGSFNNQAFIRNAIAYFIIAPSTAKLIDPFSDSGIDENDDGSYEYLEIQMPLTVNQAGNYVVSGDLYAGDTFIAPAAIHQSFQPGSQTVKLRFDGATIFASQKDGAYTVRNILLLDETEIPLLIEEKPPYTTSAYSYKDFGSKTISLPNIASSTTFLVAGGLGLLCLTILAIGGVFVYTRTHKPKRAPAKSASRPQAVKPVSGNAEQIKKAIELSKSKRHKEAFEILRGIVQAEPNNASAWFNLGGVLASMENYKDAERCYERAKRLGHPRGEDALNWLRQHRK